MYVNNAVQIYVRLGGRTNKAQRAAIIAELAAAGAHYAQEVNNVAHILLFLRPARSTAAADLTFTAKVWAAIARDVVAAHGAKVKGIEAVDGESWAYQL